ncbi:MAG: hypothetical protein ACLGHC_07985 [Alphaproteobacteria bacterium]
MRKSMFAFATLILAASPVVAQTAPADAAPATQVKMVKKTVCQRIEVEGETGSRLGSATKVCKTVEVPAPTNKDASSETPKNGAQQAL